MELLSEHLDKSGIEDPIKRTLIDQYKNMQLRENLTDTSEEADK